MNYCDENEEDGDTCWRCGYWHYFSMDCGQAKEYAREVNEFNWIDEGE